MPSASKTSYAGLNQWLGNEYPKRDDFNADNIAIDTKLKKHADGIVYETAGGTATAITLANVTLENGHPKTFIASADNNGSATTVNTKPLYKPGTTSSPVIKNNKAYTIWYNVASSCFFLKASATGTATKAQVLAGVPFSNEDDTDLVGEMNNNGAVVITPSTSNQTIATGYHNGNGYVKGDANFIADNLKKGVSMWGKTGTYDPRTLTPGDTVIYKNTTVTDHWSPSYTLERAVTVNNASGTVRVSFAIRSVGGSRYAYGKIYVNGIPRGTERSNVSTSPVTFVEDISINSGDTIQLYCWMPDGQTYSISLFQLSTGSAEFPVMS